MKKNDSENYESIEILLTKERYPIMYETKVKELMEQSDCTRKEAENILLQPIELELYYEYGLGMFGVEAEAVECTPIFSPYTGAEMEESEE